MNRDTARSAPLVLVVDDVKNNVTILTEILRRSGYDTYAALSGDQALKYAAKRVPDLVLLDIMMPEMDGFETCRRMKDIPGMAEVPIIFVTAKTQPESITEAYDIGGVDYIVKPYSRAEVLARISTHLELKRAKEALQDANEILEQRVEERTERLSEALRTLEQENAIRRRAEGRLEEMLRREQAANEIKTKFVTMVSHEFRTPMTSMLIGAGIIKQMVRRMAGPDEADPRLFEQIAKMERSLTGMTRVLDSISTWMKVQEAIAAEGYSEMQTAETMAAIVETVVEKDSAEHEIRLNIAPGVPPSIRSKPFLLREVFFQLLMNAAKFSASGSAVDLSLMLGANGELLAEIQDYGKGIREEDMPIVFDIFRRGRDEEEVGSTRGLGLGLNVARSCLHALGGTIEIHSVWEQGTTVRVSIPLTTAKGLALREDEEEPVSGD